MSDIGVGFGRMMEGDALRVRAIGKLWALVSERNGVAEVKR